MFLDSRYPHFAVDAPRALLDYLRSVGMAALSVTPFTFQKLRQSSQLLLKPPFPFPLPNLTLVGTNFSADMAPDRSSISVSG